MRLCRGFEDPGTIKKMQWISISGISRIIYLLYLIKSLFNFSFYGLVLQMLD